MNQTARYEGARGKRWLFEGSLARAENNLVETPSVNQWSVTPNTETTFLAANPDFGQPARFNLSQLETPRQIHIEVRYEF